jgi:hypothetical protein
LATKREENIIMERTQLASFDSLQHGDKIISPIDNEVTAYYVDKEGERYLASKNSIYPLFQFRPEDFFLYDGTKDIGEVDETFFS